LPFETIDRISICSPFAAVNEDAIGATGTAAWVIDGATGVSDLPPLVSGLTDAAWLAAQLNEKLHAAFARAPIDPSAALAEIDAKIQAQFSTINLLQESTASEQPSAALALSVLTDDTVHLIGIGDCRIIVENHGGDVREFDPSKSGPAEAASSRSGVGFLQPIRVRIPGHGLSPSFDQCASSQMSKAGIPLFIRRAFGTLE
jgi:hypothetical protein